MIRNVLRVSVGSCRKMNIASMSATATAVRYEAIGQPSAVLKLESAIAVPPVGPNDVAVKFLAAPINPSDLNMVEGIYGIRTTSFPAFAGGEGVAEVTAAGANVKGLKVGDWVIPSAAGFGTWRTLAVADAARFTPVPNDIPAAYAATLAVNPCTAYRLLADFENLKPGDVIIQNGANSMVGLAVIQMARERGIKTVNIIRHDRPEAENLIRLLTNFGGDVCVTDAYSKTHGFQEIIEDLPPIKLALNTIGGDGAAELARALGPNGTLVTYGAMSRKPLTLPYDLVVAKQLKLKGFWMSAWNDCHSLEERTTMLNEVADLIREKKLSFHFELHDFDDFDFALKKSQEPFRLRKVVLNLDHPDRFAEHDKKTDEDYDHFNLPPI